MVENEQPKKQLLKNKQDLVRSKALGPWPIQFDGQQTRHFLPRTINLSHEQRFSIFVS